MRFLRSGFLAAVLAAVPSAGAEDRLRSMARGLELVGDLKGEFDWGTVTDKSFLPKDLQN